MARRRRALSIATQQRDQRVGRVHRIRRSELVRAEAAVLRGVREGRVIKGNHVVDVGEAELRGEARRAIHIQRDILCCEAGVARRRARQL